MSRFKDRVKGTIDAHNQAKAAAQQQLSEQTQRKRSDAEGYTLVAKDIILPVLTEAQSELRAAGHIVEINPNEPDLVGEPEHGPYVVFRINRQVRVVFSSSPGGGIAATLTNATGQQSKRNVEATRANIEDIVGEIIAMALPG